MAKAGVAGATSRGLRSNIPGGFLIFITVYFALQIVLRPLYSSALGLDEAELLVITQRFALGYGTQPPLYTWFQIAVFELLGSGIPTLALLKEFLLWTTFVFAFLSARLVFESNLKAAAAALALFAIPQVAWESQRALSHSVLVVTIASLTLYVTLRLLQDPRRLWAIALGACWAFGCISKYNYLFFAAALALAAAWDASRRVRGTMLLALPIMAILLLPHVLWVWNHLGETLSRTGKFDIRSNIGLIEASARSFVALVWAVANYAALPVLVMALVAFLAPRGKEAEDEHFNAGASGGRKLMLRVVPVAFVIILVTALVARATAIRDRWLQPVLFVLPLSLLAAFEYRLTRTRLRVLIGVSIACAVIAMAALPVMHFFPDLAQAQRDAVPYREIAADIRRLGFDGGGYILADDTHVAGNLKLQFPASTVAEPQYGLWPVANPAPRQLLLAWSGGDAALPADLRALFVKLCRTDPPDGGAVPLSAPYPYSQRFRYDLTVLVLPMCEGGPTS